MKQKSKRYLITLVAVLLLISILAGCSGCNPTPPDGGNGGKEVKVDIIILGDLVDLGVVKSDYAPNGVNYDPDTKLGQAGKLLAKQEEEKEVHNYIDIDGDGSFDTNFDDDTGKYAWDDVYYDTSTQKYVWEDDGDDGETATFTKIFLFAEVDELINRMAAAALPKDKMIAVVEYITRTDTPKVEGTYNLAAGTGSAIRDYEELDELYDIYDEDDSDENYILLQKKRRKVMHEVFGIFGDDAAAASRTAVEILSYAQKVVDEIMIPDYDIRKGVTGTGFYDFFKGELFDYDSLVYFLAFNETCGATGQYLIDNLQYVIPADNKKNIVTLYGYYYQYEKKEFDLFNDTEYFDYLELGTKDYFNTNDDALRYRNYDRKHYAGAYRYSSSFYKKYYEAHLSFQLKQENHDIRVYELAGALPQGFSTRYSIEMKSGCDIGMEATLKLSDVNWEYSAKDSNVTNYNNAAKAYYSISETDRDNKTNAARISLVKLEVEQLKSQYYTVTHKYITKDDLGNALKYQIYSFSADYSRTIIANRKDNVYFIEETRRMDDPDTIAAKQDEIGRNNAMLDNHEYFYLTKGDITNQLNKASSYDWVEIAREMSDTINYDYDDYHQKHVSNYGPEYNEPVDVKFEDTLIKKKTQSDNDNNANPKKEYDTDHMISRLLDNHENVFRYAYGQIVVEYREPKDIQNYELIGNASTNWPDSVINPNDARLDDPGIIAISTSYTSKFKTTASAYDIYQEESFDTDENIELARFIGKWEGIMPNRGTKNPVPVHTLFRTDTAEGSGSNLEYEYMFIFEGWFVDKELQYQAKFDGNTRFGEEFDYDIRLYAGYKVVKRRAPK